MFRRIRKLFSRGTRGCDRGARKSESWGRRRLHASSATSAAAAPTSTRWPSSDGGGGGGPNDRIVVRTTPSALKPGTVLRAPPLHSAGSRCSVVEEQPLGKKHVRQVSGLFECDDDAEPEPEPELELLDDEPSPFDESPARDDRRPSGRGGGTLLHRYILDDVAEFHQQFASLQTDVRVLVSKNVLVYVLGTNHANTQCRDDVVDIINRVRPKTVLVELCSLRACSCAKHRNNAFQSAPKFTFRYLRAIITQLGFLPAMIFFTDVFREHLVSENSLLHYGGEFIAAMATAQSVRDCRIVLADRPIEITVKRQASAMGNWRGLRVTLQVTLALVFRRRMRQLMLSANRLVFDDPKTYEVLVFERDLFLTYSIQEAAKEYENANAVCRVVAVIGQGHMQGIQTYWGKVPSEFIPFIMSPQTLLDQ